MLLDMSKREIFILHPHFLNYGGASKVVLELGSQLKKQGFTVKIITTKINKEIIKDYATLDFISLSNISTGNLFFWILFPFFYFRLSRLLKDLKPTIIFAHSLAIYWGAAYKFLNKRTLVVNYFHDLGMPYTDSNTEIRGLPFVPRIIASATLPFFKYLNYKIIKKTDYLVSNSKTSANFIKKKYGRKVDLIVCPGVDVNIFKPSSSKKSYIYTLGRLDKIKNTDLIIKSFALYCKKYQDKKLKLNIMGDGIEKNNLIKLSETLNIKNKVIFIGRCNQEKVALIASRAKIGIFLCPNESFGLAAVESMACGTPVIGINTGGISETVMDGKTGALITDNENMIAEKIHQLLQNQELLSEYSQNAVNHARNSFNWDNEAMKLSVFLKSLK